MKKVYTMNMDERCDERIFLKVPKKLKKDFANKAKEIFGSAKGAIVLRALMTRFVKTGKVGR